MTRACLNEFIVKFLAHWMLWRQIEVIQHDQLFSVHPCTAEPACDLIKGSWVPDPRPPQYTNSTCKFIQGHQNCMKNGRPDTGFLNWKWKPDQCDLPRIDARAFLTAMRDRSMAFAGDSIARNQFQSLLCLLSQVIIFLNLHIQVGGYKFASFIALDLYRL